MALMTWKPTSIDWMRRCDQFLVPVCSLHDQDPFWLATFVVRNGAVVHAGRRRCDVVCTLFCVTQHEHSGEPRCAAYIRLTYIPGLPTVRPCLSEGALNDGCRSHQRGLARRRERLGM